MEAEDVATEQDPLLSGNETPSVDGGDADSGNEQSSKPYSNRSPHFIIAGVMLAILSVGIGDQLAETPMLRIYESIYCYQYWEQHDPSLLNGGRNAIGPGAVGGINEEYCKIPHIQAHVADLQGYQTLFDGIPSTIMSKSIASSNADTTGQ